MKKLISLIFFFTALASSGQSFDRITITLNYSGDLSAFLDTIENRHDVHFNYKLEFVESKHIIIECEGESLENILKIIEDSCDLSYNVIDNNFITFLNKLLYFRVICFISCI